MINQTILDQVQKAGAQLVAVTKYLSPVELEAVLPELKNHPAVCGLGENRAEDLEAKNLPRDLVHFIGRVQSRKLPQIICHCGTISSLDKLSHARKTQAICEKESLLINIFVQVNVSQEAQKGGVDPENLSEFLKKIATLENLRIVGLSGMGEGRAESSKQEFELLRNLRDQYLPGGLVSAGTSRDYEVALGCGIDIVRIGRALF